MEPLAETTEALHELARNDDTGVARTLWRLSRQVEHVVPEIVGLSVTYVEENLTFTLTATAGPVAELDAMQYLDGGPCEQAVDTGEIEAWHAGDLHQADEEERWQLFALATAAAGVASTLSLPIMRGEAVMAGINLYASSVDAFEGRHAELAEACGGWAEGAVANADLDFSTRLDAIETPERIREQTLVDQAIGALISRTGVDIEQAEHQMRHAAHRAGISDAQLALARAVLDLLTGPLET